MHLKPSLLVAAILASSLSAQSGQVIEGNKLIDHDFRFALTASKGAEVMPEQKARRMDPHAWAGIWHKSSGSTLLRVARDLGRTMDQWGELAQYAYGMPDAPPELELREELKVDGCRALRYVHLISMRGRRWRVQQVIIVRKGYAYQIFTRRFASESRPKAPGLVGALTSLKFLNGSIQRRLSQPPSSPPSGAGWELRDGVYFDAALGFKATAPPGWRLMLASEVRRFASDAQMGMTNDEIIFLVQGQKSATKDKAQFLKDLSNKAAQRYRRIDGAIKGKALRKRIVLQKRETLSNKTYRSFNGDFFVGKMCMNVQAVYREWHEKEAVAAIPTLLASLRTLPRKTKTQILARNKQSQLHDTYVDADFSLRGWTYRDFAQGFSWTKPSALWQLHIGESAKSVSKDARLGLDHKASGLKGFVHSATIANDIDLASAHSRELSQYFAKRSKPTKCVISGMKALKSTLVTNQGRDFEFQHYTVMSNGRAWYISFSALTENMADAKRVIRNALKGFTLHPEGLKAASIKDGVLTDLRLGFQLDTGFKQLQSLPKESSGGYVDNGSSYLLENGANYCLIFSQSGNGRAEHAQELEDRLRNGLKTDFPKQKERQIERPLPVVKGGRYRCFDCHRNGSGVSLHLFTRGDWIVAVETPYPRPKHMKRVADSFSVLD